jgi:hypothetical protein
VRLVSGRFGVESPRRLRFYQLKYIPVVILNGPRDITEIITAGPGADRQARRVRDRLVSQVEERRTPSTPSTRSCAGAGTIAPGALSSSTAPPLNIVVIAVVVSTATP